MCSSFSVHPFSLQQLFFLVHYIVSVLLLIFLLFSQVFLYSAGTPVFSLSWSFENFILPFIALYLISAELPLFLLHNSGLHNFEVSRYCFLYHFIPYSSLASFSLLSFTLFEVFSLLFSYCSDLSLLCKYSSLARPFSLSSFLLRHFYPQPSTFVALCSIWSCFPLSNLGCLNICFLSVALQVFYSVAGRAFSLE